MSLNITYNPHDHDMGNHLIVLYDSFFDNRILSFISLLWYMNDCIMILCFMSFDACLILLLFSYELNKLNILLVTHYGTLFFGS